jgi:Peroxiredoxin
MKTVLLALISLTATTLIAADSPPVGAAAPDFSLPDTAGKPHSLSEYKGKYVVLEWFNPECPFVKKHYGSGNMQKLAGPIHRQRCRLAIDRLQCTRLGG